MKRFLVLPTLFLFFSISFAQTQQGIVKTRGRMTSTGVVIPGTRLSGATVSLKNLSALVSGKNGSFSFAVPTKRFCLTNVQKQGYMLCDNDVIGKDFQYSKNAFVVVMETPENMMDDKLAAERQIRKTLSRQLEKRTEELELLKEEQKISKEQYRAQMQALIAQEEKNEDLIKEMANRYSTIDFDEMDELQRKVAFYIQNGELAHADSLLNTKGSMEERSAELDRMEDAIKADAEELAKRQKMHEKSVEMKAKALEDFAADCYSRYEICKLQHKNDSAAYWLELRASKDTTNMDWKIDCAFFMLNYLTNYKLAERYMKDVTDVVLNDSLYSDESRSIMLSNLALVYIKSYRYEEALKLYTRALDFAESHPSQYLYTCIGISNCYECMEENHKSLDYALEAYNRCMDGSFDAELKIKSGLQYGSTLCHNGEFQKAVQILNETKNIAEKEIRTSMQEKVIIYHQLATAYQTLNDYENADTLLKTALKNSQQIYGLDHPMIASLYNSLGSLYHDQSKYKKSIEYLLKANEIDTHLGLITENAQVLSNISKMYLEVGDIKTAEKYGLDAYQLFLKVHGDDSPNMINVYNDLGALYFEKGEYETAQFYLEKAISIRKQTDGDMHPTLILSYSYIDGIHSRLGNLEEALKWFNLVLDVTKHYYGEEHSKTADAITNIGGIYLYLKRYDEALQMLEQALKIHLAIYGETHADVAGDYNGIAQTYMAMERYDDAIINFQRAIAIRKVVFGEKSVKLKSLYTFMKQIYQLKGDTKQVEHYDTLLSELQN